MSLRLETTSLRLEAMSLRLETTSRWLEPLSLRVESLSSWLQPQSLWLKPLSSWLKSKENSEPGQAAEPTASGETWRRSDRGGVVAVEELDEEIPGASGVAHRESRAPGEHHFREQLRAPRVLGHLQRDRHGFALQFTS